MNPYDLFKTDTKMEQDGIVLDYGEFSITIARAGKSNAKFRGLLSTTLKKHRRKIDQDTLSDDLSDKIMIEIYADSIILGWANFTGPDGKAMVFDRENVIKAMTDLPDLFADISEQANQASNFRAEQLADAEKNLPNTSSTKPGSESSPTG